MRKENLLILPLLLLVSACSGNLYTVLNPEIGTVGGPEKKLAGILVYPKINVMEVYLTTVIVNKATGNVIGKAPTDCTPSPQLKFTTRTDFTSPYRLVYEPGLLETYKFSVTLEDGALKSVGADSDPSKGLTAATGFLTGLLPFAGATPVGLVAPAASNLPLCNAGPKLEGIFEAPPIQPIP